MIRRRARSRRCALRKERVDLLRDMLIEVLGNCCARCIVGEPLEIHHVDGCTWDQRRAGRENRFRRYLQEYRAGVRLQVLCRGCNGSLNQHTYGTRAEREPGEDDARGFDVTDPDLDAPDGAEVDGFVRVGARWEPLEEAPF